MCGLYDLPPRGVDLASYYLILGSCAGDRFFYGNDPGLTQIRRSYGIDYRRTLAEITSFEPRLFAKFGLPDAI